MGKQDIGTFLSVKYRKTVNHTFLKVSDEIRRFCLVMTPCRGQYVIISVKKLDCTCDFVKKTMTVSAQKEGNVKRYVLKIHDLQISIESEDQK